MLPLQLSSGDLVADRRADYARMLFEAGDFAAARDLMRDTLALVPAWVAGWYRLGEICEAAGSAMAATAMFREALRLDPADRLGAGLKLAAAGHALAPNAAPAAFVEALFDQYAHDFDESLVERLNYRVPEVLADALLRTAPEAFAHAVDLGCGTGLMAERLVGRVSFIEGVDISSGMLKCAAAKRLYGRLTHADIAAFDFAADVDLVTAADVFIYVGALDALFTRLERLSAGAIFAFSAEAFEGDGDMVLRPSRRYAHSESYLRRLLHPSFDLQAMERTMIRMDRGHPIEGFVIVARRKAP